METVMAAGYIVVVAVCGLMMLWPGDDDFC